MVNMSFERRLNMNRDEAIQTIEGLYPADSEYDDTAAIGEVLLRQARFGRAHDWRNEPTDILVRYAELCISKEVNRRR